MNRTEDQAELGSISELSSPVRACQSHGPERRALLVGHSSSNDTGADTIKSPALSLSLLDGSYFEAPRDEETKVRRFLNLSPAHIDTTR